MKRLETGSFSVSEKQNLEAQTDAVMAPGSSISKQENLDKVQGAQQEQEPEKPKSWRDSFAGGLFGSPYANKQEAGISKAQEKIAKRTGKSVEEIKESMTGPGYQSGKLLDSSGVMFTPAIKSDNPTKTAEQLKLAAQQAYAKGDVAAGDRYTREYETIISVVGDKEAAKINAQHQVMPGLPVIARDQNGQLKKTSVVKGPNDQNGNPTYVDSHTGDTYDSTSIRGIGEAEAKASENIRSGLRKESMDHAASQAKAGNILYSTGMIMDIGEKNRAALTQWTSGGSTAIDTLAREGVSLYNLASEVSSSIFGKGRTEKFNPDQMAALERGHTMAQKNLEQIEKGAAAGRISEVTADAARIEQYATMASYELAMVYGQEGRSLSNEDWARFRTLLEGKDPNRQREAFAELFMQIEGDLDRKGQQLFANDSPQIADFYRGYQYNPLEGVSKPLREAVIDKDPFLSQTYQKLVNSMPQRGVIQRDPLIPEGNQPAPGQMATPQGIQVPQRAVQALRQNPELIEQFKAKYGLDDSQIQTLLQGE